MTSPLKSERDYVYECSVCKAGFYDVQELLLHSEKHDMKSSDTPGSSGDIQIKTEPHVKKYSCVECTDEFDTYSELQAHAEMHSEIENSKTSPFVTEENGCSNASSISNASPTSIMGSVRRQKLITNSDILERLKKRVFPVSPSKIDDDDDDEEDNDSEMDSERSEYIRKSIASLKCEFCGKTFTKRDNIKKHIRIHTGEKPYQCPFCEKCFSCSSTRTKHVRVHTGEKPYFCKICGSRFSQSPSLKQHALKQHGVVNPVHYVGQSVDGPSLKNFTALNVEKYDSQMNVRRSSARNTKTAMNHCEPCEMWFNSMAEYETHLEMHRDDFDLEDDNHDDDEEVDDEFISPYPPFVKEGNSKRCTICGQSFSCKSSLKRHFRIHSGERPFKCHVCSRGFSQGSTLKKHIQRIHKTAWNELQRTKPFESRHFRDDLDIEDMMEENDENEELALPEVSDPDILKCRYCKVQFANLRYLTTHERTHTAQKTHICKHCGRCFGYKSHLKRHMLIHTGEKPYKCRVCKMTFRQKVSLISHFRNHHKSSSALGHSRNMLLNSSLNQHTAAPRNNPQPQFKPYKCEVCNKTFQLRGSLTRHSVYHNYGNPLKCTTCGKHFKKQAILKEHMKTHMKTRVVRSPHECSVCGNRYRYAIQLKKHMTSHTEVNMSGDANEAEINDEFFIEDTIEDEEVSDEGSYETFLSERREGVLMPLDPEFIDEACSSHDTVNGTTNDAGTSNYPLDYLNDDEFEPMSDDDRLPNGCRRADAETDPSYFPCKRPARLKKRSAPVSLGSDTLIKLSISMNSGRCSYCGKAFSSRSDMRRHLRTHTGEKPFECDLCGGRFTQKKSLVEHQRTHTGERPHKCDVCGMNFRYRSHLGRHMKRNGHFSEVEPLFDDHPASSIYSCIACNKQFINLDELRQHLEGVHGIGEDNNIADEVGAEERAVFTMSDITKSIKLEPLDDFQVPTVFESIGDAGLYTCDLCKKDLTNYESWIKHMDSHPATEFTA